MKKVLATIALVGVAGVAQAAPATLTSVTSFSSNGSVAFNLKASTATWDLDTGTGTATQTGGTMNIKSNFFTHTMTGGVLGSGTATGSSWACIEGAFGPLVGAHLCGNFLDGANNTFESTVGNSGTATTVTIGGDDIPIGAPQSLANSYSNLALTNLGGGNWKLGNGVVGVGGYDFVFNVAVVPVPAAVWLFGSALGLMGVMRRRAAV